MVGISVLVGAGFGWPVAVRVADGGTLERVATGDGVPPGVAAESRISGGSAACARDAAGNSGTAVKTQRSAPNVMVTKNRFR